MVPRKNQLLGGGGGGVIVKELSALSVGIVTVQCQLQMDFLHFQHYVIA